MKEMIEKIQARFEELHPYNYRPMASPVRADLVRIHSHSCIQMGMWDTGIVEDFLIDDLWPALKACKTSCDVNDMMNLLKPVSETNAPICDNDRENLERQFEKMFIRPTCTTCHFCNTASVPCILMDQCVSDAMMCVACLQEFTDWVGKNKPEGSYDSRNPFSTFETLAAQQKEASDSEKQIESD